MADTLLLMDCQILGTNISESADGKKVYRTAYLFIPGAKEGYDGKPQMIEMSFRENASSAFNMIVKNEGKTMNLVGEKMTFRDGGSVINFHATLDEMMKSAS